MIVGILVNSTNMKLSYFVKNSLPQKLLKMSNTGQVKITFKKNLGFRYGGTYLRRLKQDGCQSGLPTLYSKMTQKTGVKKYENFSNFI